MKRKILAMFLCVALTFAIFGTLAVGAEENVEQPAADPTCTCGTENETHAETCALYTAPEIEQKEEIQEEPKDETKDETKEESKDEAKEETKDESKDEPKDETEEETKEEPKVEPKDETKDETKEEPKVETPVCNCGAEDDDHKETCPLYKTLFQRLMACEDFDSLCDMIESLTQEEWATLDETMLQQLNARLKELEPEPAVIIEEPADIPMTLQLEDTDYEEPRTPAVDYTNVAPIFGK